MAPWTIDLLSLDGMTTEVSAAPFQTARVTWAADGTGSLEVQLRPTDVAGGDWAYGRRRIAVRDGAGTRRYQGWLERLERAGRGKAITYRAASLGLASILAERFVHGDFNEVELVATDIAQDLLDHISAQTDDATGFTAGAVTGVAATLTRYFCDGDVVADAINEIAQTSDGGFAWEIDAEGAFNAWVGGRGTNLSGSVTLAPSDAIDWALVGDATEMATYATGIGGGQDNKPCGPPLVVASVAEKTTYGRREVVVTADTESEDEMLGKAEEELRARVASRLNLRTAWIEGRGPWSFGDLWIGDVVNAELGPEFGGDAHMRLISITVTLEAGVHEFLELEWEAA